jgi:hypothetical protein
MVVLEAIIKSSNVAGAPICFVRVTMRKTAAKQVKPICVNNVSEYAVTIYRSLSDKRDIQLHPENTRQIFCMAKVGSLPAENTKYITYIVFKFLCANKSH